MEAGQALSPGTIHALVTLSQHGVGEVLFLASRDSGRRESLRQPGPQIRTIAADNFLKGPFQPQQLPEWP